MKRSDHVINAAYIMGGLSLAVLIVYRIWQYLISSQAEKALHGMLVTRAR